MGKRGRPRKGEQERDARERLIDAAVELIGEDDANAVTVRAVCERAGLSNGTFYHHFRDKDALMATFVDNALFGEPQIAHAPDDAVGVVTDLYLHLVRGYVAQGVDFMRRFYSTGSRALSAYMGMRAGRFADGTVMARSETALLEARSLGAVRADADVHQACADVCTVVKGCMFEWCLSGGAMDVEAALDDNQIPRRLLIIAMAGYDNQ